MLFRLIVLDRIDGACSEMSLEHFGFSFCNVLLRRGGGDQKFLATRFYVQWPSLVTHIHVGLGRRSWSLDLEESPLILLGILWHIENRDRHVHYVYVHVLYN